MDATVKMIIDAFITAGPIGIAMLAILAMAYYFHNQRIEDSKEHTKAMLSQHESFTKSQKEVEDKLMSMIQGNTEALTRFASTQENCTAAIKEMTVTLNSGINLLNRMASLLKK